MIQGGGMRGKDEMARSEAFGSPRNAKMPRAGMRDRKNRGMLPPGGFDIDVPRSSNLTALEAASMLQQ
jgi:hypothetical protein